MKYSSGKSNRCHTRETRAIQGSRFRILLIDAGLSIDAAAQMLHVTPRTIRYWISGKVTVPYAAYKLLRIMRLFELPCPGWDGWHMHSGKLWSPEGYGFTPNDSEWWSSLVRKSRLFHVLYDRERELATAMDRMKSGGALEAAPRASERRRGDARSASPNLLLEHFRTTKQRNGVNLPSAAMEIVAKPDSMSVTANKGGL